MKKSAQPGRGITAVWPVPSYNCSIGYDTKLIRAQQGSHKMTGNELPLGTQLGKYRLLYHLGEGGINDPHAAIAEVVEETILAQLCAEG